MPSHAVLRMQAAFGVTATRLMAFKNASAAGFHAIGGNAAAPINLAVVFNFHIHFALCVLADGDRVHPKIAT